MKKNYSIRYVGDANIKNVHYIGVDYDGKFYIVIFGEYENGGFFSIPNWNAGGELSRFDDVFWNVESLNKSLLDKEAANAIALAIAEFNK